MALWQVGETEHVGTELNRAFVDNDEKLDPAMAALARDLGVTNIELRASEASVARGLLLTGLFPVPPYEPQGGYRIDKSLVLAFARIESRFQNGATSAGGRAWHHADDAHDRRIDRAARARRSSWTIRPIPCRWASVTSRNCSTA